VAWTHQVPVGRAGRIALLDGELWVVARSGLVEVLDPATGEVVRTERGLAEPIETYSQMFEPLGAGDRVVIPSETAIWGMDREVAR
jgi:hypothetical protein